METLQTIGICVGSGQAAIDDNMRHPRDYAPGVTIVGYRDEQFIHLLPEVAYRAVNKVHALKFPVGSIGSQLKEEGWLLTNSGDRHLTVRIKVREAIARMWRLKASVFDE